MGWRTINKYMGMAMAGMFVAQKAMKWADEAKQEDSPGGEDITPQELVKLDDLLSEAFQVAGIPVKITAEWLG